jgi:hypothetical protein
VRSPLKRVGTPEGRRGPRGDAEPPRDERTALQVLLGDLVFAALAGLVYRLLGGDPVASITFGVIVYVIFLFLDLQVRRRQREREQAEARDGTPPEG